MSRSRLRYLLLAVAYFASVLMGPLAHAHFGEDFDPVGLGQHGSHAVHEHGVEHGSDHGHSHDDVEDSGDSEHSHEHKPWDHSHEVPGVAAYQLGGSKVVPGGDYLSVAKTRIDHASFNIDRPPRR